MPFALKGRLLTGETIAAVTGAHYAVAGSYRTVGSKLRVDAELLETRSSHVLWADTFELATTRLLIGDDPAVASIVSAVGSAVIGREIARGTHLELPTLEAFAILFRGISMMHHSTREAVAEAQRGLSYLIERHPRSPEPRVWMAKCHVLRVAHGEAGEPHAEAARARDHVRRALELEPQHALAHAIDGLVQMFIGRDLNGAESSYKQSLESNPNESLGWLFLSSVHAHRAEGSKAMACVERATQLSPLDPLDHYFNGFTAWAALSAGEYERAELFALRAMRAHCTHLPTFTTLAQAQTLRGKGGAARNTAAKLMALSPSFSASRYLRGFPGGDSPYARTLAMALRDAGVPP